MECSLALGPWAHRGCSILATAKMYTPKTDSRKNQQHGCHYLSLSDFRRNASQSLRAMVSLIQVRTLLGSELRNAEVASVVHDRGRNRNQAVRTHQAPTLGHSFIGTWESISG